LNSALDSKNYSATAEEDDGSCAYEGAAVFWFGKTMSDSLQAYGITELTYYVDGQLLDTESTSTYWTSAPTCGQDGSATVTKDLGGSKSNTYNYSVKNGTDEITNGTIKIEANSCFALELQW